MREGGNRDFGGTFGQPVPRGASPVDAQVVQDQEHLAASITDEALEAAKPGGHLDGAIEWHPAPLPLVGHRRDQTYPRPLVTGPGQGCPPTWREAAATHIVRARAGFVAPRDRASRPFGAGRKGRVIVPQPARTAAGCCP